jgi:hypothetical protein
MNDGFVKNEEILKEDYKVSDLFDFSKQRESFSKFITSVNSPSIIGYVGQFGCGKSTLLYSIQKEREIDEKWINFDAWKFPDRKDLWEGFVLEFSKQISEKDFKKTKNKLDGKNTKSGIAGLATSIFASAVKYFEEKIPDIGFLDQIKSFFETSPARRVFEIQEVLKEIINKEEKNIFVIIEDIDRSGDAGIYFLETARQFINNSDIKNKITFIVPIADHNFYQYEASFLKCLDFVEFFDYKKIEMSHFIDEVFDKDLLQPIRTKTQIVTFFEELLDKYPDLNLRKIKLILRKANSNFIRQKNDGLDPDFRVTIALESAKHFQTDDTKISFFDKFKKSFSVTRGNIFCDFLYLVLSDRDKLSSFFNDKKQSVKSPMDFKCFERKQTGNRDPKEAYPSKPWQPGNIFDDEKYYCICDFYLKY